MINMQSIRDIPYIGFIITFLILIIVMVGIYIYFKRPETKRDRNLRKGNSFLRRCLFFWAPIFEKNSAQNDKFVREYSKSDSFPPTISDNDQFNNLIDNHLTSINNTFLSCNKTLEGVCDAITHLIKYKNKDVYPDLLHSIEMTIKDNLKTSITDNNTHKRLILEVNEFCENTNNKILNIEKKFMNSTNALADIKDILFDNEKQKNDLVLKIDKLSEKIDNLKNSPDFIRAQGIEALVRTSSNIILGKLTTIDQSIEGIAKVTDKKIDEIKINNASLGINKEGQAGWIKLLLEQGIKKQFIDYFIYGTKYLSSLDDNSVYFALAFKNVALDMGCTFFKVINDKPYNGTLIDSVEEWFNMMPFKYTIFIPKLKQGFDDNLHTSESPIIANTNRRLGIRQVICWGLKEKGKDSPISSKARVNLFEL